MRVVRALGHVCVSWVVSMSCLYLLSLCVAGVQTVAAYRMMTVAAYDMCHTCLSIVSMCMCHTSLSIVSMCCSLRYVPHFHSMCVMACAVRTAQQDTYSGACHSHSTQTVARIQLSCVYSATLCVLWAWHAHARRWRVAHARIHTHACTGRNRTQTVRSCMHDTATHLQHTCNTPATHLQYTCDTPATCLQHPCNSPATPLQHRCNTLDIDDGHTHAHPLRHSS